MSELMSEDQEISVANAENDKNIFFKVCGTDSLAAVEIVKNGLTLYRYQGKDELDRVIALTIPDRTATSETGDFYYLRAQQSDGSMAWASPIWVTAES
ncbi:hypothetical protein ACFL6S_16390 [Candidatus Poribacteria bacterium]